ncbi:putative sulfur metabolite repression control protein SconB [Pseudovirgaria hyperparasitica]|uniref:Putative sulfur metabolite repression control protein SconB n=1 Tax=Pseudovirgaria hyperparasitica TaxID=470096 RepID=A0A6A6VS67_9PEZI|nr:putative sulfur metabolite repression control protein SconB [Pseudovirgaria hyperparasitica]KAF2752604.1 putative sulfur metabolite repression control protein SconB [Pseudovirgaria hyperparasitica]
MLGHDHQHLAVTNKRRESKGKSQELDRTGIFLSSSSKEAHKMISPFLTQHIPQQYNPRAADGPDPREKAPSKFCYRHRPDVKCRRTANEPTMEELQNDLGKLSQSDQQGISHVWSLFSAAPSKHRNLMLQGILAQCCYPQLSYISNTIRDLIKIDFLDALPPELSFKILLCLDTTSLCKASQVSRKWRKLADDDVVWHKMCEQHIDRKCTKCGWGLPLLEQKRLRTEKRQMQLRASNIGINEWSPNISPPSSIEITHTDMNSENQHSLDSQNAVTSRIQPEKRPCTPEHDSPNHVSKRVCTQLDKASAEQNISYPKATPKKRPWKDVYKDRFKVGTNWKYGRCTLRVLKGHTKGVMCLQFVNNILATGSYDNTAKIWDLANGQELRTLTGHTSGIRCLQFDESRLFTGSTDTTLKVWNWRTGECVKTFRGHTRGVISLHFSDKILASGSMDHTIKIWHMGKQHAFTLRGHTDWVNSVRIDSRSRTLFSASDDCTARLWDLDTRECLQIFKGHVGQVQQVLPLPQEFEFDEDPEDIIHEGSDQERTDSDTCDKGSKSQPFPDPNRACPPKYMLTGSLDSTIRLWHVPTGKCIRTFFGHLEGVWALAADTLRMVSGAEDRMVKVWDPRSGQHERTFTDHTGPVTCVGLSDSRLVSASEDASVRIYSFEADNDNLVIEGEAAESRVACRGTPG